MWFEQVLFFLAGIGALAGALGVVILRNPFYSVLALVAHLVALAVLFLLLHAEFLAAGQVVVLGRRPATRGVVAVAWRRQLRAERPDDPALREFADFWLGRGARG